MKSLNNGLSWLIWATLLPPLVAGPWLFAAWEGWWFWPLTACITTSLLIGALRLITTSGGPTAPPATRGLLGAALVTGLVTLLYLVSRALHTSVVYDAQRHLLLFLLPLAIGLLTIFGMGPAQRRALKNILMLNLALLACYGLINHAWNASTKVLWRDGYAQYIVDTRLTGSYFCPDHFAGLMELTLCLALGVVACRRTPLYQRRAGALLSVLAIVCVVLTKSRGGVMTLVLIGAGALLWAFQQFPRPVRHYWRMVCIGLMGIGILLLPMVAGDAVTRFTNYAGLDRLKIDAPKYAPAPSQPVLARLSQTSRGRMFGGACRAWQQQPIIGIGAGMHRNLWPTVAASGDGDRDANTWPSQVNDTFHSYHVHSDWLQLLEEFGLIGLGLVLLTAGVLLLLYLQLLPAAPPMYSPAPLPDGAAPYPLVLTAILAMVAMGFHSLGDFNLQMPATGWIFGLLLALPLGEALHRAPPSDRDPMTGPPSA